MAKKKQNYNDLVHASIDRLEKIKDQDDGYNEIFTHTIDAMILKLFKKTQKEWKKRNSPPEKRSKKCVSQILTEKGTDKTG